MMGNSLLILLHLIIYSSQFAILIKKEEAIHNHFEITNSSLYSQQVHTKWNKKLVS